MKGATQTKGKHNTNMYKKYAKTTSTSNWLDPSQKLKPSDLSKSSVDVVADDYPMIVEFNNIMDNTSQVHSTVDIDQPLFQPSPKVLVFEDYAPFAVHEKKLYFRNNDSVARRIKVLQPESLFFELSAPKTANGEPLKQSKIAAGMEIFFTVRFKPQEVRDYALELVCSTEREKFIVPIRAVGMHPKMTFPDDINFGTCPVKSTNRKTLLVQNLGSSEARFSLRSLSPEFTCASEEMVVEAGGSQILELYFTPTSAQTIFGEFEVEFTKGVKCYITATGSGKNIDVALSTPSVTLESSYISLSSQKTMRIKNTSDIPINFMWKSFSNEEEEEVERSRLLVEINRMEAIEMSALQDRIRDGYYGQVKLEDDDSEEEDGDMPFEARVDEATLVRKYRNLRTALQNDSMQFVDDIFEMTPVEGQVWAHSEMEITITFRPDTAAKYTCLAFLNISGRQDRLPLHMSGQGIGPHASLSFDVLNVGDVFINDEQEYDLAIVNKGDIPAQWTFMSSLTKFGNKFNFFPKEGYLRAGQTQAIKIKFESDILGEFSELFRFALQGNDDMLVCQIKGHVVGPTFHFDCNSIDFGVVSFDYLHSTSLRLVNTSKIPMVYNLRVPQDGTYLKKEFEIAPNEGTLRAGSHVDISVDFIPGTVKEYDYSLAVDVLGVGELLLSIPLHALCRVVPLRIAGRDVEFGDCFVRFPYEKDLLLTNPTEDLHIKFEMLPQLLYTMNLGTYEAEPAIGVIEPGETMAVKLRLVGDRLGNFKIPVMIAIAGSQEPPIQANIQCNCIGPRVLVDSNDLRWGNIECLRDSVRTLKITNDSFIPAQLTIFLKMARSKFEITVSELTLEPKQVYDLDINANLDDSVVSKDELHILVNEGENIMVPLSAKGIGTTMSCATDLQVLDLGVQLTNTTFEKRIVLENKGRRPQALKWTNITVKEENINREKKARKTGREGQKLPKHLQPMVPVFVVTPEEITLRPRSATTFIFRGTSASVGSVKERFVLESKVGKERAFKRIIETDVCATIVNPLLEFSRSNLHFEHRWVKDMPGVLQRETVTLRNAGAIALSFLLKVEVPFNLNLFDHSLQPGESVDIDVEFDPFYKDDLQSHVVDKQLAITYRGHTQKDSIPLTADIIFPNVQFDCSAVAFGSVLNDVSKKMRVKVTNSSKVVTKYEWMFVEDAQKSPQAKMGKSRKNAGPLTLPPEHVFDILPVRSVLQPGESEDVEFTLLGVANHKFAGIAICVVEGGPEYKLPISGEASTVSFSLERQIIDFGKVMFTDRKDEELVIVNDGKVAFKYQATPAIPGLADVLDILPSSGTVQPGEKFKVVLRVKPGLPESFAEDIVVQVAHFDPILVKCYCQGIFPVAMINLPRHKKVGPHGEVYDGEMALEEKTRHLQAQWSAFQAEAATNLFNPDSRVIPPSAISLAATQPLSGTSALPPVYVELPDFDEQVAVSETRPGTGMSTKPSALMAVEVEMQRLSLCHHLKNEISLKIAQGDKSTGATPRGLQALITKHIDFRTIVAANYICDFGNVIVGQTKKKVFQISNASAFGQLNWTFEKKTLSGSGFSIDPDKVSKLPEQQSVDVTVKFAARVGSAGKVGRKDRVLSLQMKASPTLNIIMTANVCMPEIEMSVYDVDMGRVLMGCSRQMFVRLHNISPVSATWKLKTVPGKEEGKITISPLEGTIKAGRKVIVCIEFMPSEPRKYALETLLRVESNSKPQSFKVTGEGVGTAISFEPTALDLGPIIPFSEGDEKIVTISNPNDTAVEIYSVELDDGYREEEEILSAISLYDGAGVLRTQPRLAGDPLPPEVLTAYSATKSQSRFDGEEVADEIVPGLQSAPIRKTPAPRDDLLHQDILVVGPPVSGVSSVAHHLSKKLSLPIKTIDEMLEEVLVTEGEVGFQLRRCFDKMTVEEKEIVRLREEELAATAEKSKTAAAEAFKKQTKGKVKVIPDEVYNTPEVLEYEMYQRSGTFNDDVLAKVFEFRLTWEDVGYGVIVDNVQSKYVDVATAVGGLKNASPKLFASNIVISGGEEGYNHRMKSVYDAKLAEISKLKATISVVKKSILRTALKGTRKPSEPRSEPISEADIEIPVAIPSGDESWIDPISGAVLELDPLELRALDEKPRATYTRQYLYQCKTHLEAAEVGVTKILQVWNPIGGIRTTHDAITVYDESSIDQQQMGGTSAVENAVGAGVEGEEGAAPDAALDPSALPETHTHLLYHEYISTVTPVLEANFKVFDDSSTVDDSSQGEYSESVSYSGEGDSAVVQSESQEEDSAVGAVNWMILHHLEGEENEEELLSLVTTQLPPPRVPPPDKDAVPPSALYQTFRKPIPRVDRKPVRHFEIIRIDEEESAPVEGVEGEAAPVPVSKGSGYRWIIQPQSKALIKIRFTSKKQGKFDTNFRFEVVGTQQSNTLYCTGVCDIPAINTDTRFLFTQRMKMLIAGAPPPLKRFVIAENFYSFGPILKFKKPEWRQLKDEPTEEDLANFQLVNKTNVDTVYVTNTGRYKCTVDIGFETLQDPARPIFFVDHHSLELEEGEKGEVKISAFPNEVREYANALVLCVSNNPTPLRFDLKCWGVYHELEIRGPWVEGLAAAEAAVQSAGNDKKKIKEAEERLAVLRSAFNITFDRMLIGKTEQRTFEVYNPCKLPMAFEIDVGDFADSENLFITPLAGILKPEETTTITLSFTSREPLLLAGKFTLRYSDCEGGLQSPDRVVTQLFAVEAEAYNIQAVSLTSEGAEEGGAEVDFGLMRVGDVGVQTMQMGNKGKYQIGFKFVVSKLASFVKIEPEEGIIDSGDKRVEIKITFCLPHIEKEIRNNKDIKVLISEPLTGEIVETFPLYLSAHVRYCQFRMQPAKGLTFGAVRFDAESTSKRIELRNEGNFEFTYVVCPAITEHDELDVLESPLFDAYTYAVPHALRKNELGDPYLTRAALALPNAAAKGKGGAAPAPKKGAAPTSGSTASPPLNPLVKDPDGLVPVTFQDTALALGAFNVFPRMGIVQPGQSIGIDVKFDPVGSEIVHEKLRVCISGISPSGSAATLLRSFEITAESCIPAISIDEPTSTFEEQEIVSTLAECLTGANAAGSLPKIENLPVGKVVFVETDKTLVFGPVMCVDAERTKTKPDSKAKFSGCMERIKITNPTKIPTKVNFAVLTSEEAKEKSEQRAAAAATATAAAATAAAAASTGKADPKGNKGKEKEKPKAKEAPKDAKGKGKGAVVEEPPPLAFSVHPECWDIPPHEHRFVNVYFNPTEIKSYRAVFNAEVDCGGSFTTAAAKPGCGQFLSFDLGGSGTLPCVAIEYSADRNPDGSMPMSFGKVHVHRSSKKAFVIRNDGVMPATCLFELSGDNDFFFPLKGSSLLLQPGQQQEVVVTFAPVQVYENNTRSGHIKVTVLNNQFGGYSFQLDGTAYACDAIIDTIDNDGSSSDEKAAKDAASQDEIHMSEINLAEGPGTSSHTIMIRSRADHNVKFELSTEEALSGLIKFSPRTGHLGARGTREIKVIFSASEPIKLEAKPIKCTLQQIEYKAVGEETDGKRYWGEWDDSMKSARPATDEDRAAVAAHANALKDYKAALEAESKKGKKAKPVPVPAPCYLELGPVEEDGSQILYEVIPEPAHDKVGASPEQQLQLALHAVADVAKYTCEGMGENLPFRPTYMFQTSVHRFKFTNSSNIKLPIKWSFDNIKRRGTAGTASGTMTRGGTRGNVNAQAIPCPFTIEPAECEVAAGEVKEFALKFSPMECDDYVYKLRGDTSATITTDPDATNPIQDFFLMIVRGSALRPVCHFDIQETPEYLTRRPPNMKNENGLISPIECGDLRLVELESCGLRTRNTFRFYVTNPTADDYEFGWVSVGDPSPAWRCVQASGMLFSGKRVEMVFEYLPEETAPAESFYKFKLHGAKLEQLFLFAGKVTEPRVSFSVPKVDFHSVMLGGEGGTETIYIDNQEHLPFNFAFDKASLLQLEGPVGPILDIEPKSGTVMPHSRFALTLSFHPHEEVIYNFNIFCDVKRKPNRLSINVKGEGYAVHPLIQLEQTEEQAALYGGERYLTLRPSPSVNYADFGAVQVLDVMSKQLTVLNAGKYNFDYYWDTGKYNREDSVVTLTGGRPGGTLHKGDNMSYKISFAPQAEESLDGSMMSFTVAGKYIYNIIPRGIGVKPALRFSFMQHDFGPCFITSPGGSTVVEEAILRLINHDPTSNIAVECVFQKTRALWADCPPTVLEPGNVLDVPIRFAPREVKDYAFVIPFVVNGTSKVPVNIVGSGISARVELASAAQRRTNFGVIDVGSETRKTIGLVNKSKKAIAVQLLDDGGQFGGGALEDRCVTFFPKSEIVIAPRETVSLQVVFCPHKRIPMFSEDLLIRYAGLTRKLLNVSAKAQGVEVNLDTDSLPFGVVVMDSQKVKKVALENTGDLPITFQWMDNMFGPHFSITPLSGKVLPGSEITFDVIFKPKFIDEDIRQDRILLSIPGLSPLQLTCTGSCIQQPSESIKTISYRSRARKEEIKTFNVANTTDKDWYLSPSLQGEDWVIPHEFKVPAKGSADLNITYLPRTMRSEPVYDEEDKAHTGQVFLAMPDGSAHLIKLRGYADAPECSGLLTVTTPAKKAVSVPISLQNWLPTMQKFSVSYEIISAPSPATFIVVANAVEVVANAVKEFPVRFVSYVKGFSQARITFTNESTGEYAFYDITGVTTAEEELEAFTIDSPVRQTARHVLTLENPLGPTVPVRMASPWWSCDSKFVRVVELAPLTGNSEGSFEVEYRPLLLTSQPSEHVVSIFTEELGVFKYKVKVSSSPPTLRQILRFNVPLGSMQAETFIFRAYNTARCEYACSLRNQGTFAVAKSVVVDPVAGGWDGDDIRVDVTFEPTEMGEIRDVLTLSSPEGGEYVCELVASCVAPLPQGPFDFTTDGRVVEIPFRNCFDKPSNWTFSIDSTAFRVAAPPTPPTVPPKTQGKCGIVFEPKEEHMHAPEGLIAAKLFIKCSLKPEVAPWVFYLRGKIAEGYNPNEAGGKGKKK